MKKNKNKKIQKSKILNFNFKNLDKPTFDNIGNTTIIPTSVIVSIKKITL